MISKENITERFTDKETGLKHTLVDGIYLLSNAAIIGKGILFAAGTGLCFFPENKELGPIVMKSVFTYMIPTGPIFLMGYMHKKNLETNIPEENYQI